MTAIGMVRGSPVPGSLERAEPEPRAADMDARADPSAPLHFNNDGNLVIFNSDYVAITDVAKTGTVAVSPHGGAALYGWERRRV